MGSVRSQDKLLSEVSVPCSKDKNEKKTPELFQWWRGLIVRGLSRASHSVTFSILKFRGRVGLTGPNPVSIVDNFCTGA